MNNSVVITGMGLVTPLGCGADTVWKRLTAGESGISELSFHDASEGIITYPAGMVPDRQTDICAGFNPADYLTEKNLQRSNRYIQFAVAATGEALRQAGWQHLTMEQKARTGVVIGSSLGGIQGVIDAAGDLARYGRKSLSPFTSPLSLISMAAGTVSIQYGFRGPSFAPATACTASLQGLGEAFSLLQNDDAEVVVAGGSEASLNPVIPAGFRLREHCPGTTSCPYRAVPDPLTGTGMVLCCQKGPLFWSWKRKRMP